MKALLFVLAAFSFSSAHAASAGSMDVIQNLVLRDFNAILSDTYNEGEGYAEAKKAACTAVKTNAKGTIVYCTIEVRVQPDSESRYANTISCTSMGYLAFRNKKYVENFAGWQTCVENLNNITEN